MSLEKLQKKIGYHFKNPIFLETAFLHRSTGSNSYERLEFLGDNVLGLIISEYLYITYKDLKEGKLSRIRAHFVCTESLVQISIRLELFKYLVVKNFKGLKKHDLPESLHADIVESLIGAIYLDAGYEVTRDMVLKLFFEELQDLNVEDKFKDSKTVLQEKLQGQGYPLPNYKLEEIVGRESNRTFHVECCVECMGITSSAVGNNRKHAEQLAARKVLSIIKVTEKENIDPEW